MTKIATGYDALHALLRCGMLPGWLNVVALIRDLPDDDIACATLTRTDADADACTAERLVFSVGSLVLFDCPLIWFDRDPFAPYFAPPRKRP